MVRELRNMNKKKLLLSVLATPLVAGLSFAFAGAASAQMKFNVGAAIHAAAFVVDDGAFSRPFVPSKKIISSKPEYTDPKVDEGVYFDIAQATYVLADGTIAELTPAQYNINNNAFAALFTPVIDADTGGDPIDFYNNYTGAPGADGITDPITAPHCVSGDIATCVRGRRNDVIAAEEAISGIGNSAVRNYMLLNIGAWMPLYNNGRAGMQADMYLYGDDEGKLAFEEYYAFFEGTVGRIEVGTAYGPSYRVGYAAPSYMSANRVDDPDFINNPIQDELLTSSTTLLLDDNALSRINYFSPEISGFMLMLGVAADNDNTGDTPIRSSNNRADITDIIEVGLAYELKTEKMTAGVSLSSQSAKADSSFSNENPSDWRVGASLSAGDVTIGGGYREKNDVNDGTTETWSAGITYERGPTIVGVAYLESSYSAAAGEPTREEEWQLLQIGGSRSLGKGVEVGISLEESVAEKITEEVRNRDTSLAVYISLYF